MDKRSRLRPLYLWKILAEMTDEDNDLTTNNLIQILEQMYNIKAHRQTVKTDIELLQQFGIDINEKKSTQNRYSLVNRQFKKSELKLLIDAVKSSKFICEEKSSAIINKIGILGGKKQSSSYKRNIFVEGQFDFNDSNLFVFIDKINDAINDKKKISFQYFQHNVRKEMKIEQNGEAFIVTPLTLVWNGDYYYFVGINDYSQDICDFRIDRIVDVPTILDEDAILTLDEFNVKDQFNLTFYDHNRNHCLVELICDNSAMDTIVQRFGTNVTTYANDMESFKAVVDVAISSKFFSWVFENNGLIKISTPQDVKETYISMIKNAFFAIE